LLLYLRARISNLFGKSAQGITTNERKIS